MADVEDDGKTCKECGKSFSKKWRLEEHKRSHTGERPYHCLFDGCGKSFIRPYHLKRHMGIHTGQSFKCSYPGCTQTFSLKHSMNRHAKRSHNNPFKCEYDGCHLSFKKNSQLTRHICVHTNEYRFKCQVEGCGASFYSSAKLQRHMRKHNKGYVCSTPGCSAAFDKFSKLAVHIRSHGYQCQHCDKKFSQVWELRRHAAVHNNNRKMYECPREGCSRVYTKAFNLRVHIKAFHEGNRPYVCTWEGCGKGFAHKVSLRQHLVLHSQRRIKPTPPPQDNSLQKKKKKRKPLCIAKKLSGYRSSPSESSDNHCTETTSRRRQIPDEPQRNETATVTEASEMNPVVIHNGTPPAGDCSTSCTLQSLTESTNLMSSSKDSVTTSAHQDSSERMQIDVISGTCRSSSLLSSRINSETTLGSQVRSEEMEGDNTAAAASSSILMASNNGSVSTTANEATSGNMQAAVISASSPTVMSSRNVSEATIPNKGMSDEKQADVFSGASLTLMTSSDDPVSTFANKQGTQAGDASAGSSTLVTSRYNSTAVEITSTLASANFQEQHEEAFTDDEMFSSSDEDGEGMDWEPAFSEHSGVESLTELDLEPEKSCESIRNNLSETDDFFMIEDDPKNRQSPSEPPENSSTSSPQRINAEMVSTALTTVSGSDTFDDNMPLSLLAEVSSTVRKAKVSVTRGQGTKKKKGKGMKENSDVPVDDGHVGEVSFSGSEEIVSVLQPDPPATAVKGVGSNGGINEGVDALGNTGFPGMDDVLQVIIEEEENALNGSHLETGLQTADDNMDDECVEINSLGDSSEERKSESMSSNERGISSPREELNSNEGDESGGNLLIACGSLENTNSNDRALPDEQGAIEMDSVCEVSNDYGNVSSDEESISVLEQQKSTGSASNAPGAHEKGINEQGCLSGSTQDTGNVETSGAVARDQGVIESQVTRQESSRSARGTVPEQTVEVNNADDLSSVEITNDRNVPRTLPRTNGKSARQKKKKNASTKGSVNERSSSAPGKPAVPRTVKSTCKSAHLETGLETADVNMDDECVEINSLGDSNEERKSESMSSNERGISSPREELNSNEGDESGGNLLIAYGSHENTNSNDGALPDEQGAIEMGSVCEVSNDYGNVSSDEESISVVERHKSAYNTSNVPGAHNKGINEQGCLSGSTQDTGNVETSGAVARDQGVIESQVTRHASSHSVRGTAPEQTVEINVVDDLSSVEITNGRSIPRTLSQSNTKSVRQKNKKNASAKGSVSERSSSAPGKPAGPRTVKSTGAHRASQSNANTAEGNDVDTETEGNSQTIKKIKEEPREDVSKAKFRSRGNIFACDLQTLELLWNFKGR